MPRARVGAAQLLARPVVLVVNARGAALSVVAAVQGFLDFAPDNNVQGVILNGCSAMSYGALARELESRIIETVSVVVWRVATSWRLR